MSTTVTKNKNRIEILVNGKTKPYVFDINTGIFYGLRGNPVKTVTKEVLGSICYPRNTNLASIIYRLTYGSCSDILKLTENSKFLQLADSLDNLGIIVILGDYYYLPDYYNELINNKQFLKDFISYAQKCKKENQEYDIIRYKFYKEKQDFYNKYNFDLSTIKDEGIKSRIIDISKWATPRQMNCYLINFIFNDYYQVYRNGWYPSNSLLNSDVFKEYCDICEYLDEKVTLKDNILSHYGKVHKEYMRQKEEIDAKRFADAIAIHKNEMEFEYGDFKIVVPTTPQDIKDEGRNMHHCVASYAYYCMETGNPNRSYIVFVRRKNNPEKCYITCEIRNGVINQYFLSRDRRVTDEVDLEFKRMYQKHLSENWKYE